MSPAPGVGPREVKQNGERFYCSRTDGERDDGLGEQRSSLGRVARQRVHAGPHRQRRAEDGRDRAEPGGQLGRDAGWTETEF